MTTTKTRVRYVTDAEREAYRHVARYTLGDGILKDFSGNYPKQLNEALNRILDIVGYLRYRVFNEHLSAYIDLRHTEIDEIVGKHFNLKDDRLNRSLLGEDSSFEDTLRLLYDYGREHLNRAIDAKDSQTFDPKELIDAYTTEMLEVTPLELDQIRALALGIIVVADTREQCANWSEVRNSTTPEEILEDNKITDELLKELSVEFRSEDTEIQSDSGASSISKV